ncbi:hypothetical protein BSKO_01217 [Bryopsis sp. KO-2023]|nr:hypothetical protein BSKO_01217 [Bryopsis sp. KO-2023]
MLRLLALGIFLLEAAAAGTPWNLFDFKLCKRTKLEGIQDNASGATYNPTSGTLWVITNAPKHLLEYSISGELKRKVAWSGFIDPEGLTWISGNKLAVVEEPLEGGISLVDVSPKIERVTQSREKVKVKVEANKGLEGLSYDPRTEHFFVVQELKPKRVLEVSKKGDFEELFNADHFRVGDFSGIHYAPQIQQLFILSQESKRVMRITKKGFMVQSIGVEGDRPEVKSGFLCLRNF